MKKTGLIILASVAAVIIIIILAVSGTYNSLVSSKEAVEAAEAAFQVEEVPSEEEEPDAVFRIYVYGAVRCLKILTVRITANILKY